MLQKNKKKHFYIEYNEFDGFYYYYYYYFIHVL